VEFGSRDVELSEFFVAYLDAGFILSLIQRGANDEPRLGRGVCNEIDNCFVRSQRTSAPVFGNEAE